MNTFNPELDTYAAEQMLIRKFKTTDKDLAVLEQMADFCKLEPEDSKRYQTYLSLQRFRINMAVVDIVLMGLTAEMKAFALSRYRDDKSFHRIAMELFVGVPTLHKWKRTILRAIAALSMYTLTEEDIYRPYVVRNMIHLLDMRINTFQETEKLAYNKVWLEALREKRRKYRQLLEVLMQVQSDFRKVDVTDREYIRYQVINEKIGHPHENVSQIAKRCGVSLSTVHKHLKGYTDKVQKFIA